MLVSGIGNPEAFADTCRRANQKIVGTRWFPDHHHYTENDRAEIEMQRQELGARRIMTTLKDLVKMPTSGDYVGLEIAATFPIPGQKEVMESLLKARLSHMQ
jgi:tetraacyldisaccharide 4'-kinase